MILISEMKSEQRHSSLKTDLTRLRNHLPFVPEPSLFQLTFHAPFSIGTWLLLALWEVFSLAFWLTSGTPALSSNSHNHPSIASGFDFSFSTFLTPVLQRFPYCNLGVAGNSQKLHRKPTAQLSNAWMVHPPWDVSAVCKAATGPPSYPYITGSPAQSQELT